MTTTDVRYGMVDVGSFWPASLHNAPNASDSTLLNNGGSSAVLRGRNHFSTHESAQYCPRHICPSLTSFVRFFDFAEGVYSTSSASELGVAATSSKSTARHGVKDGISDRPGYVSLAKGTDVQFPSRLAAEQVISVAPSMLK